MTFQTAEFSTVISVSQKNRDTDLHIAQDIFQKSFPDKKTHAIHPLNGDASVRRYLRVTAEDGFKTLVQINEPFEAHGQNFPFLEVQKHLIEAGLPVPKVFASDPQSGSILIEDLGDITFLRRLQIVNDDQSEKTLYLKAVDLLAKLHHKASSNKSPIKAFQLEFDTDKLFSEVDFAFDELFQKHLQRDVSTGDKKVFTKKFKAICEECAEEPKVFTHRDFHSRNLLVSPEDELSFIDFQDARLGLRQYDLCSLLRDSYYRLPEYLINECVDHYIERTSKLENKKYNSQRFHRLFDLCTLQRNFKAIGTFCYIDRKRDNNLYLKYIGNTFENIRTVLKKYPEFKELKEVLFKYYYF
jgi:hypothetical protein